MTSTEFDPPAPATANQDAATLTLEHQPGSSGARLSRSSWPARWTSDRVALWVFVAYLVVAFFLLIKIGNYRYFLGDEWDFLSTRSALDVNDLFRPHNQHWSTLPLIEYRVLFTFFGVRSYLPYQIPVILLHLTSCGLLRIIMRRAGVIPWLASIAAGVMVLFGPGQDDIVWAFQSGFTGSVVFGLTQLILSDHPGRRIDKRDWLGLAAGACALMCSNQGPALVVAVGVAVLLKRGWKMAAFHTVPLGLAFAIWFKATNASLQGLIEQQGSNTVIPPATAGDYAHWFRTAFEGLIDGIGYFTILGVIALVVAAAGWTISWLTTDWKTFKNLAAVPFGMVVALIVGNFATVPQRFFLAPDEARASRYLYIAAALSLPALAFGANAIIERWRWTMAPIFVMFLLPIPFNAFQFNHFDNALTNPQYFVNVQQFVTSVPESPLSHQVPRWVQPNPSFIGMPGLTVGWLLDAQADGKLPEHKPQAPLAASQLPVQLGVPPITGPVPPNLTCRTYDRPLALKPKVGDVWAYDGALNISTAKDGKRTSFPVIYSDALENNVVEIALPDREWLIEPAPGQPTFTFCK